MDSSKHQRNTLTFNQRPFSWEALQYCGNDIPDVAAAYAVKTAPWDSLQALGTVERDDLIIDPEFLAQLEPILWNDLASEYDAENFCNHLERLERAGLIRRSDDFLAFENAWRRDELNHTLGFARIYSLLYQVPEDELLRRLRSRPAGFDAIEHFLRDEFSICVVIAYDEIATTRSYKEDHTDRYPRFGNEALVEWIRLVARDEAMHFQNILNVIVANHSHRISEVPALLDQLISWDGGDGEYGATFVLDHEGGQFTPEFLANCRRIILRRLGLKR